ncbi:DNA/RNA non-specific endonuclease [Tardiphaga sp.]|uniref:DNA/RNA non-specific endonuclease n=1 Tax=Tardiphaga sp. TaxID=1926292 RepID=UPI0025FD36AD|nr:DNA/RNA non-specific endonuclease [Tardiphaga sp.]
MPNVARAVCLAFAVMAALPYPAWALVCADGEAAAPDAPAETVNDPENCRALWEKIGLPQAGTEIDAAFVCHQRYVLLHNNENKTPDWVIEPLNRRQVSGTNTRPEGKKFAAEEAVCDAARAVDKDYTKSGYDRGHQAASADFSANSAWMDDTFVLSNAVPQEGIGFNRGIWKQFEALVRKLAQDRGELYVITGPIYANARGAIPPITKTNNACKNAISFDAPAKAAICPENSGASKKKCESGVAVPVGLFKILYDPAAKRANAYVMPNIDHRSNEAKDSLEYLKKFRTTVKIVERYTGFQFLPDIPGRKAQIEECVATMMH